MWLTINLDFFYHASIVILLISSIVHCGEQLAIPRTFINFVYSDNTKTDKYRYWIVLHIILLIVTLGCLTLLLITGISTETKIGLSIFGLILYRSHRIRVIGKDGADQLRLILSFFLLICFLIKGDLGKQVFLSFVGLQLLVAYTTSGLAKVLSPYWRKGNVLASILSTHSYGHPPFSKWLSANPRIEKAASHGAIACMLSVIISFAIPYQAPLLIALGAMLIFHIGTALLMGLNDFLLTFPAAYPGILYLHHLYMVQVI